MSTPNTSVPASYRTSRQKSCAACARAKRRCNPQTPQCSRCASRGLRCVYKNEPLKSDSEVTKYRSRSNAGAKVGGSMERQQLLSWTPASQSSLDERINAIACDFDFGELPIGNELDERETVDRWLTGNVDMVLDTGLEGIGFGFEDDDAMSLWALPTEADFGLGPFLPYQPPSLPDIPPSSSTNLFAPSSSTPYPFSTSSSSSSFPLPATTFANAPRYINSAIANAWLEALSPAVPRPLIDALSFTPSQVSPWAIRVLLGEFRSWPALFARSRRTPFIHKRLYDAGLPDCVGDAFSLSAVWAARNADNAHMVEQLLERETRRLVGSGDGTLAGGAGGWRWSLDEHLAKVQSLMLLFCMHAYGGGAAGVGSEEASGRPAPPSELPQYTRDAFNPLTTSLAYTLDLWTAQLFGRAINLSFSSSPPAAGAGGGSVEEMVDTHPTAGEQSSSTGNVHYTANSARVGDADAVPSTSIPDSSANAPRSAFPSLPSPQSLSPASPFLFPTPTQFQFPSNSDHTPTAAAAPNPTSAAAPQPASTPNPAPAPAPASSSTAPSHPSAETWASWQFHESLRRTVLFSLFLTGGYSVLRTGLCRNVGKMRLLRFTERAELWDVHSRGEWVRCLDGGAGASAGDRGASVRAAGEGRGKGEGGGAASGPAAAAERMGDRRRQQPQQQRVAGEFITPANSHRSTETKNTVTATPAPSGPTTMLYADLPRLFEEGRFSGGRMGEFRRLLLTPCVGGAKYRAVLEREERIERGDVL